MEDRELLYVSEYHGRLIATSATEHALRELKAVRPSLKNYVLLHTGSYLISIGERLRSASTYPHEKPVDLAHECC